MPRFSLHTNKLAPTAASTHRQTLFCPSTHAHTHLSQTHTQTHAHRRTCAMAFQSQAVLVQEPDSQVVWHLPALVIPESVQFLGGGTFGRVVGVNTSNGGQFAVKKFTNPFQDATFALRTYREICILRHLSRNGCPHVLQYIGTYSPQPEDVPLQELYVVTEKCDSDLRTVLRHNKLTVPHIQLITYRILCGLYFIHSAGVIHRDLKPENVAIFEDCSVRIIDMGLSRGRNGGNDTPYVQTRFYRAPEVVALCEYDQSADVWSFGCILCECFGSNIPFPGRNTPEQFYEIFRKIGTPPQSFLDHVPTDAVRTHIASLGQRPRQAIQEFVPTATPEAADLLDSIFVYYKA
ncbi:CMGC/MAPK/P38 protein kinase [Salpingoeca rosetta]|uniref:CMGC/MAPK/P38 protein kinase n=1 Tax=Salpingoeca rosetta (strain ATCC 50818 / BSB-021) TaxID=946362 RepID=F2U553_SALR5|nr:CMGC/MAPK/P38 protein kinase [Salpingoeca rosetta]EGD82769.1 CMGC/MAPK/P38 protein kinase [Salpingoeca rosetta]|eukprot:XP_004996005.1 CMGC/MAPK/P38 protein kinase [Salpingoeca rosetta]